MGNAAMIDTDCRLCMEFSENINAIGRRMNTTAQKVRTLLSGSCSGFNLLYE